jgi:hypothetical protein
MNDVTTGTKTLSIPSQPRVSGIEIVATTKNAWASIADQYGVSHEALEDLCLRSRLADTAWIATAVQTIREHGFSSARDMARKGY